jgi:hypothetical protein
MAFEVQQQTLCFLANDNPVFTFTDTIQQYVVGLTAIALNYSANQCEEFWVLTINVSLDVVGVSGNTLTVYPNMTMISGVGNFLAGSGYSWVNVTVLAWTGSTNNSNLILASNIQNQQIALPSTPLLVQPVLSGFNLSFGIYPQNPTLINISTGISQTGSVISSYGLGSMYGSCNFPATSAGTGGGSPLTNYSVCNSGTGVNTGLIVNCDPGLSLVCNNYLNNASNAQVNLPATVQGTFLTGFFMYLFANTPPSAIVANACLTDDNNAVDSTVYILSGSSPNVGFTNFVTVNF